MAIPVFVINLDRSPHRLAHMKDECSRAGMDFERVPAVDGRAVPPSLRPQFLDSAGNPLGGLADGEIGCYASHLVVHQRILTDGLDCALVLEDDAGLRPHLVETAQAAVAAAPGEWDFIHLSAKVGRAVCAIAALPHGHHLIRHLRPPRSTGAYIISRSGAAKMLQPAPRLRAVDMDMKLAHERNLNVLGVYPSPAWSHQWPTTMAGAAGFGWDAPSRSVALKSFLYAFRTLGAASYIRCSAADAWFSLCRRIAGRRRDAVPVVMRRQAP